ncbi:unnamed protein product [Gongylonema pulchrum]|uniref:DNA topoisomerase (ATP-hydrolyzing) n=1 Tax=Gongylonema pulchrum TaxID=637853 RepID=A0A183EYJ4_9BILA|nr:unnamed protein product [Gongylonema pulchrum]
MIPWFKNFRGTIEKLDETRYVCSGEVAILSDDTIEITELPIRTWTQNYKESVLEPMLDGSDKHPAVLFDALGCLRKFNTVEEICKEFFETRKKKYIERKAFQEGMLRAQSERLSNQVCLRALLL